MNIMRHHLLEISSSGRERLFNELDAQSNNVLYLDEFKKLIRDGYESVFVPGIARRDEDESANGMIPVGFASLNRIEGNRLRVPAYIYEEEIVGISTPYGVIVSEFKARNRCMKALQKVIKSTEDLLITAGIWGSAGLELYTGLPFTDDDSDIDILIKPSSYEELKEFYSMMNELSGESGVKIDAEIDLPDGNGIKLAELFMDTETVLCKSINGVSLINRNDILDALVSIDQITNC